MGTIHVVPVLEYATHSPSRLKRWLIRGAFLLSAVGIVYLAGCFVPLHRVDVAYMCRICGHAEERSTWDINGLVIWRRTCELPLALDSIYQRLICTPHQHRMFSYANDSLRGDLWHWGGIGEGGPREPAMAVRESLEDLDALESENPKLPLGARRLIYARLLKCKTRDEVRRFLTNVNVHEYEKP